jgi:predicted adenylyl cyclase CyaB
MPRNVEIKARIESLEALLPKVAALAEQGPFELAQDDTFFACERGRLKLRIMSDKQAELIFYRRADEQGPKESFYLRAPSSAPEALREVLVQAYGQVGRVRKQRTLFLVGRTRVHLDRVQDLGEFLELEVGLGEHDKLESGVREAHALMEKLGLDPTRLVEGAYVDLLAEKA